MRPVWLKRIDDRVAQLTLQDVASYIAHMAAEVQHPHNHGWTEVARKKELYQLKCLIEDIYAELPDFGEKELDWEKERLYNTLKTIKE